MRPWPRQENGLAREEKKGGKPGERMESEYVAMTSLMRWNYDGRWRRGEMMQIGCCTILDQVQGTWFLSENTNNTLLPTLFE